MTSKHLFFKLQKEDAKHRLWSIVLMALVCFFALPVSAALTMSQNENKLYTLEEVCEKFGADSGRLLAITVIAAVVLALSGFRYLHSARMIDFYHSQPIRRGMQFVLIYVNGILIYALPYLAGLLASLAVLGCAGFSVKILAANFFYGYFVFLLEFAMLYSLAVIAVELTGKLLIGAMGILYLAFYPVFAVYLVNAMMETFFRTFMGSNSFSMIVRATRLFSPVSLIVSNYRFLGDIPQDSIFQLIDQENRSYEAFVNTACGRSMSELLHTEILSAGTILLMLAMMLCSSGIALLLFWKRSSESAGKAMAFDITRPVIKFLTVIPGSAMIGIFFYSMTSSAVWFYFGVICAAALLCGGLEVIYETDIRAALSKKGELFAGIFLAVMFGSVFYSDWFGYDTYLPEKEELAGVSLDFNFDSWAGDYNRNSETLYNYYSQNDRLESTVYTNLDVVYPLLEYAVSHVRRAEKVQEEEADLASYASGADRMNYALEIVYRKKNGKEVRRRYNLDIGQEVIMELAAAVYDDPEYREQIYPLFYEQVEKNLTGIYREGKLSCDSLEDRRQALEFLRIYREEFRKIGLRECFDGTVVCSVSFTLAGLVPDSLTYPVYDSFTQSLAWLKEHISEKEEEASQILFLWIYDYQNGQEYSFNRWDNMEIIECLFEEMEVENIYFHAGMGRYSVHGVAALSVEDAESMPRPAEDDYDLSGCIHFWGRLAGNEEMPK